MNPQRMEPTDQPSVRRKSTASMRSHVPALGPPGPTFGNMRSHVPALGVESANSTLSTRSHVPAAGVGEMSAISSTVHRTVSTTSRPLNQGHTAAL